MKPIYTIPKSEKLGNVIYILTMVVIETWSLYDVMVTSSSMLMVYLRNKDPKEMTKRERMQWKKMRNESYSLWMTMLYGLSLANHVGCPVSIATKLMHAVWCSCSLASFQGFPAFWWPAWDTRNEATGSYIHAHFWDAMLPLTLNRVVLKEAC